jgi:prepilin-type N-terminal cleavage/methylation domain-containing protein/prepilin-type processing-associated H-X9-DG protein
MKSKHGAFTLVELLVVVVILAVLASIVLPVTSRARESGRRTTCQSNLRQLYAAFALYASNYDDALPPYQNNTQPTMVTTKFGVLPIKEEGAELIAALKPYIKMATEDLWFCPSDPVARTDVTGDIKAADINRRVSSYSVPFLLGVKSHPVTLSGGSPVLSSRITPAELGLVWDAIKVYGDTGPVPYTHSGKHNCVYFDGHVESIKVPDS